VHHRGNVKHGVECITEVMSNMELCASHVKHGVVYITEVMSNMELSASQR